MGVERNIIVILLFILIIHIVLGAVVESHSDENKCTPKDTRQIYPRCMQYSVDKSVWCDQSNYTRIPDPDKMLTYKSCRDASALFINDSCLHEIEEGDLKKYQLIRSFKCGRNYIKKLPDRLFIHNKRLQIIDLCENRIGVIGKHTFTGLSKLEVLNLANNIISEIPFALFQHTASLTEISFHNNKIQVLEWGVFFRLNKLEVLRLSGNRLKHIEAGSFRGLESLTHLHLDQNKLEDFAEALFDDLPSLKVLTASHNNMLKWPALGTQLSHLHTINFAFNYIGELKSTHIAKMSKLQNLSLENNSLSSLSDDLFESTAYLRYLNIGDNDIEEIGRNTFSQLCHLETLVLRGNGLKTPHAKWFESMIKNGVSEGTDIAGNEWKCECSVIEYAGFLESLRRKEQANSRTPAWSKTLQIICDYPKQHKGEPLDDRKKSQLVHQSGCPEVDFRMKPVGCNTSDEFIRTTETFEYSTVTPVHSETTKPPTTTTKYANFKEEALPEIGALETTTDVPLIVVTLLIIAVIATLGITVRCLTRNRSQKNTNWDLDSKGEHCKAGQDKTEKEPLRDSRSESSFVNDANHRPERDKFTKCHETRATSVSDAMPASAAMQRVKNSGNGGSTPGEEEYTGMRSLHESTEDSEGESQQTPLLNTAPDTALQERDETRPKERAGVSRREAELRVDPDGTSLTGEFGQSTTVPKQLRGNATG